MPLNIALPIAISEPIGDFESLVNRVKAVLDRDDFTKTDISSFIALAETYFNLVLRVPQMEKFAALTAEEGETSINLPADFLKARALYNDCGFHQTSPQTERAPISSAYYTIVGRNPGALRFHTPMRGATSFELLYYAAIPTINENNADNWLLNDYPAAYYYGTLAQAEAFTGNDERAAMFKSACDEVLALLSEAGIRDRYGSGPLVPKTGLRQVRGARI